MGAASGAAASSNRPGERSVADHTFATRPGYARRMSWTGQDPPANDVILHLNCRAPAADRPPIWRLTSSRTASTGRLSARCSSFRKSAGRVTWRRWCARPTSWPAAACSTTWCGPSGRCGDCSYQPPCSSGPRTLAPVVCLYSLSSSGVSSDRCL